MPASAPRRSARCSRQSQTWLVGKPRLDAVDDARCGRADVHGDLVRLNLGDYFVHRHRVTCRRRPVMACFMLSRRAARTHRAASALPQLCLRTWTRPWTARRCRCGGQARELARKKRARHQPLACRHGGPAAPRRRRGTQGWRRRHAVPTFAATCAGGAAREASRRVAAVARLGSAHPRSAAPQPAAAERTAQRPRDALRNCRRAHLLAAARLAGPRADTAGRQPCTCPDAASDWPAGAASRRSAARRFTPRIATRNTAPDGRASL